MADQILFDKLRYIDRLVSAGIELEHARAHAEAMEEALRESVATKSDITKLEHKIELAVRDITVRIGAMIGAGIGILAALKFFGQ